MTRFNHWMAPLVALAFAIGFGATAHQAVAQQNDKKQAEQSSKDSSSGQQKSDSGSQSGSPSGQSSNTQSNQRPDSQSDNKQQSNSQANANQNKSDQDSKANQSQQGQAQSNTQSNQRTQSGQGNTQGQSGSNTRSNQNANQNNQANQNAQNRDDKSGKNDNQNRDNRNNDRNNTNIAVGIQFGAVNDRGLVINTVQNNSFFYRSGFRQNDVIISIGGQPIRNQAVFIEYIGAHRGERIPVIVLRDNKEETVYVVYEDANLVPPGQPGMPNDQASALLGVTFDASIPNAAVVREVHPGGPAAQAGVKQGDEIVVISGKRVNNLASVNEIVGQMKQGDRLEIDFLQLKHAQITLANNRTASTASADVRVDQGVQQSNYQAGAAGVGVGVQTQGSNNQGQNADRNQPNRNQNQNSNNRGGIIPRIR